jgi:chemotaxis protein methyltransferase CheR
VETVNRSALPEALPPRKPAPAAPIPTPTTPRLSPAPMEKTFDADSLLEKAAAQIRLGRHEAALETMQTLLERQPNHVAARCLLAQAQANAGQLDEAEASCAIALGLSPFAALPFHLRARIAEERGASDAAKTLLKKVIYLNPRSVWGALELGAIYAREGDGVRATQMRRAALGLLDGLNDEAPVPVEEYAIEAPLSVGELKRQLGAELEADL